MSKIVLGTALQNYEYYHRLLSKLRAVLHTTVAQKIVETVPSIKISHGGTETNRSCSSSSIISTSFFRLFILLNLKQLHTNTITKLRHLYCWFCFDICTTFWPFYLHIVFTMYSTEGTVSSNSQRELWTVQRVVFENSGNKEIFLPLVAGIVIKLQGNFDVSE